MHIWQVVNAKYIANTRNDLKHIGQKIRDYDQLSNGLIGSTKNCRYHLESVADISSIIHSCRAIKSKLQDMDQQIKQLKYSLTTTQHKP